jgi:hypothetical protein
MEPFQRLLLLEKEILAIIEYNILKKIEEKESNTYDDNLVFVYNKEDTISFTH